MFKNRIRTAAIAGIAALATGVGAVTVPATAQDTVGAPGAPAGQYWVDQDASAAFEATPVNHTEEQIKRATDATQQFIQQGAEDQWKALHSELNYDPSEEGRADDIRTIHESIIDEQEVNSAAIKQIQESIAYAFEQDKAATAAWQAVVKRAHEINQELRTRDKAPTAQDQTGNTVDPDGENVNYGQVLYIPRGAEDQKKPWDALTTSEKWTILEYINFYAARDGHEGIPAEDVAALQVDLGSNPSDAEVIAFYEALYRVYENDTFQDIYDQAGDFFFDQGTAESITEEGENQNATEDSLNDYISTDDGMEQRFSRYAAKAIVELYGEVEGYIADLDALIDASEDASREAQQSDVLVRQGYLYRALAQREVLRNAEGLALAWARYYELYNDDTFTGDRTLLSTEYRRVLDNLAAALWGGEYELDIDDRGTHTIAVEDSNYAVLQQIDNLVAQGFDVWSRDLNTNADVIDIRNGIYDDWNFELVEERIHLSAELADQIVEQGRYWREPLNRVSALEKEIAAPSANDLFLDRLEEILNGTDGNGNGNETPTPNPDNGSIEDGGSSFEAPSITGGSSDLGGFGIAAVIAAIIGVLALVVPNIQNFL